LYHRTRAIQNIELLEVFSVVGVFFNKDGGVRIKHSVGKLNMVYFIIFNMI